MSNVGEQSLYEIVTFVYTQLEEEEERIKNTTNLRDDYLSRQLAMKAQKAQRLVANSQSETEKIQQKQQEFKEKADRRQRAMQGENVEKEDEDVVETLKKQKIEKFLDKNMLYPVGQTKSEKEIGSSPGSEGGGPSRFQHDFKLLKILGKGAFGCVFKVLNNLDGNKYAVKRMVLNYAQTKKVQTILTEVQLLSQLHHMNIVRYNQAWTESISEEEMMKIRDEMSEDDECDSDDDERASYIVNNDLSISESSNPRPVRPTSGILEIGQVAWGGGKAKYKDNTVSYIEDDENENDDSIPWTKKAGTTSKSKTDSSNSDSSSSSSSSSKSSIVVSGKPKEIDESKSEWDSSDNDAMVPEIKEISNHTDPSQSFFDKRGDFHTDNTKSIDKNNMDGFKQIGRAHV